MLIKSIKYLLKTTRKIKIKKYNIYWPDLCK